MMEKIGDALSSAIVGLFGIATFIIGGAAVLAAIGVFSLAIKFFWFGATL